MGAQMADKGNGKVVSALISRLEDIDKVVMCAEHDITEFLSHRLDEKNRYAKKATMLALAHVAERGDERAITALRSRLDDEWSDVRQAAVQALSCVQHREAEALFPSPSFPAPSDPAED